MNYFFIKCIKIIVINSCFLIFFYIRKHTIVNNINNIDYENLNLFNKTFCLFNYLIKNNYTIYYFKISDVRYFYSFKHKKVKIEYNISIYNEKKNFTSPSDISLYNNISLLCNIEIINNNISIDSLANIKDNKYFNCIEYFNLNESIAIGIKVYNLIKNITYNYTLLFKDNFFNFNNIKVNIGEIFDSLIINNEYNLLLKNINNDKLNYNFKLKKSYMQYPLYPLKRENNLNQNQWKFENILNDYFCFCQGLKCLESNIDQYCKFNFYINIIDNSRDLYSKTDYLFVDFIFSDLASDDVYPIFEEMEKQNYPVHYITEKYNIYKKFCDNTFECLTIISITKENYYNCGDFLQKYLTLILKLKAFISGKSSCYREISDLFYNIEYITYIAIGHGVCYFKDYLYKDNRLYGIQRNDKILLSSDNNTKNFTNQSILIMFTWRDIKKRKKISQQYINNSIKLLNDLNLKQIMEKYNIILYFTFHRFILNKYKKKYKTIISSNKYINYIDQNEISNCLSKSSLVVSDFSSIIFDFMYRRKPYIIFIPDANDSDIKNIYKKDYYFLIESLKNGTLYFENKFFDVNSTVEKINYYIKNNFTIEKNLMDFYDSFELEQSSNINNFINYLLNLK